MSKRSPFHPISTHAMRRWIERVEGVETDPDAHDFQAVAAAAGAGLCDLEDIRRRILGRTVLSLITIGEGSLKHAGWRIVVKGHIVVTILNSTMMPMRFDTVSELQES